ncbi:TRS20 [Candida pseudojiufengensis]|uniref:TRS20 n=1 Tax=Candida pseudojiufengensis TaxID=497109 RepID=UPI002224ED5F|nr:TRS20 [Candida pseudojiufengensis]KAI5966144.1 TRS20 [Candida pseudojiufengensis]
MSSYYFVIIGTEDNPIYETELSSSSNKGVTSSSNSLINNSSKLNNSNNLQQQQSNFPPSTREILPFIANASLDLIEDQMWSTQLLNLGKIDQFYGIYINAYLTQGNIKFILCHNNSNKDENSIKSFFQDINELYVKILMNPFYNLNDSITLPDFDLKVKLLAKKFL